MISPEGIRDLEEAQRKLWGAKRDLLDKIAFHLGKLGPDELMAAVERLVQPRGERGVLEKRPPNVQAAIVRVFELVTPGKARQMRIGGILASLKARGWLKGSKDPRGSLTAALSKGVKRGVFTRVEEGIYQLAPDTTANHFQPHRKVKVTVEIVWGVIPQIVDDAGQFMTPQIRETLGCKGEQLATPLAMLRDLGLIERAHGRSLQATTLGKEWFGKEPRKRPLNRVTVCRR